jgi:hypothetical protein
MPAYGPYSLVAADFNRDRSIDLAVAQGNNNGTQATSTVAILLGHGDGTFSPAVSLPVIPTAASIMAVDLNGDNILDLFAWPGAAGTSMGTSGFLIGNGWQLSAGGSR